MARYSVLILFMGVSAAFAAEIPDYPFVFVTGKADTKAAPDIAFCSLTVRAREQESDKAASIVHDRVESVLATLRANHVAAGDIESFNIEKQVLTNENEGKGPATIRGYDVWRDIKFTVRKLESIAPIEVTVIKVSCRAVSASFSSPAARKTARVTPQ